MYLWRMPEMDAPRALVFRPLVKGNEALGTRLGQLRQNETIRACASSVVSSWLGQRGQLFSHINAR